MTRADLPAVLAMEGALFGAEAWTEGMLAAELAGVPAGRYYLVADDDARVVGYAGLLAVGSQADVLTMAVAQDRWGQGIGGTLLRELLAEAARRGCGEVFLEVRVDNARAQQLYRGHGFTEVGLRRGYYQPSGTDALVMRRPAGRAPDKAPADMDSDRAPDTDSGRAPDKAPAGARSGWHGHSRPRTGGAG
jgi:[ribosomal protein S18]-alanine N-acetyltransferase